MTVILAVVAILIGFAALVWSADKFVLGASATAYHFGVSPLLIGILIVGLGTSAPEMLVAAIAATQGNPGLAIGNALGSNITNIGLIIGVTALAYPLFARSRIVQRELPLVLLVTILAAALMLDGVLDKQDGMILLIGLAGFILWSLRLAKSDPSQAEPLDDEATHMPRPTALLWLVVGMALLIASSRLLVWGAVTIAQALGINDLIIGLTIIAIGTSLPELAASLSAAKKGEYDLAFGNVIGSNLFNLLAVLAIPSLMQPGAFESNALMRDVPIMLGMTIALWLFASNFKLFAEGSIGRIKGGILLAAYCTYLTLLVVVALQ